MDQEKVLDANIKKNAPSEEVVEEIIDFPTQDTFNGDDMSIIVDEEVVSNDNENK